MFYPGFSPEIKDNYFNPILVSLKLNNPSGRNEFKSYQMGYRIDQNEVFIKLAAPRHHLPLQSCGIV